MPSQAGQKTFMKPTLDINLNLNQQLTMTPQLQQAIRLLQLSTLDLQQEIQQALDSNPLLEQEDAALDNTEAQEEELVDNGLTDLNAITPEHNSHNNEETGTKELQDEWSADTIPDELPLDSVWDDIYQSPASLNSDESSDELAARTGASETLRDHLEWQLNLTQLSDTDRLIGIAIIESIDDNGYLTAPIEEIYNDLSDELDITRGEIEAVLSLIQQFEPVGVGCRDLRECLLIQLQQLPNKTDDVVNAYQIIDRFINQLGNHDYNTIMRRMRLKEEPLRNAISLIQTLTPHPGAQLQASDTKYVTPDVLVSKKNGRWLVELNPEVTPKLRVNNGYAAMVRRADNSPDNNYLKSHLYEARWLIKSLQSRNETLLKVATKIVDMQRGFFDYGEEAMKPLILRDIAEAVEMHESTISRVTTQKYMLTSRGIFELKYFFSSHVSTTSGGECSSTAIRALIKKLVSMESPRKPLSDSKIAVLLEDQGIKVARRTIAKYREGLHIPPSNERKRLV